MAERIKEIVTHLRPHADELVALMLLRKFPEGEEKFPGVSTAKISFLTSGELPDGKNASDFPDKLFLGVGGGIFDEHATAKKERVKGETCATLVANYLDVASDPALLKILHFIREEDLYGSKVRNEIPMIVKFLHQCYGDQYEKIYEWVQTAYWADYQNEKTNPTPEDQWERPTLENIFALLKKQNNSEANEWKKFADGAIKFREIQFENAKSEFAEKGSVEKIQSATKGSINVAFVESDNEEMNKYARSAGAHLVVQVSSRGNVIFMTDRKKKLDLCYLFILLRMAEQHFRGEIKIKDEATLSKEGFVEGIPYWYLFHTFDMGFNGSLTTTDIEPTKIPHEKLFSIVREAMRRQ